MSDRQSSQNITPAGTVTYPLDPAQIGDLAYLNLDPTLVNPAWKEGRLFYDMDEKALSYYNEVNGVTVNLGQENYIRVTNKTGSTILNGTPVYINGAQGFRPTIALAKADALATSESMIGVVTNDIANNGTGYATTLGLVHDLNTNAYAEGDVLYLSAATAGAFTTTRPTDANYVVRVAIVTKQHLTQGHILVMPEHLGRAVTPITEGGTGATTAGAARDNLGAQLTFNGLEDNSKFTGSYNSTNRELTITYAADAAVWVGGVRYPKSGSDVLAHTATLGLWFYYYDTSGTLVTSQTPWNLLTTAPVFLVYYNATTPSLSHLFDERHPGETGMADATHRYLHLTRGTQLVSGCVVSGYGTLPATGTNIRWASSSGTIADEDLSLTVAATTTGDAKRILYKIGSSASPRWDYSDDIDGILDNGTNIYYNQNNAGTWQLTAITTNNTWVNYWIMATDVYTGTGVQIWTLMGQTTYASLADAQAAAFTTEMSDVGSIMSEGVVLYKMTYRRGGGFGAPGNAELDAVTKITQAATGAGGTSGAITGGSVSLDVTNFDGTLSSANTTSQSAFNTLDGLVNGIFVLKSVTTTYTQEALYNWFNCSASADYTITLLTAAGKTGQMFVFKLTTGTGNIVTIDPAGSETIDGFSAVTLQNQYDTITLVSDGTNWMRK